MLIHIENRNTVTTLVRLQPLAVNQITTNYSQKQRLNVTGELDIYLP